MNNTAVLSNEQFVPDFQQYFGMEMEKVEYAQDGEPFGKYGDDIEEVENAFCALIEKMISNPAAYETPKKRAIHAGIKFKRSECRGMDKQFRKEFEAADRMARVEKRENDDGETFYTIRYRSNGYNLSVSASDLKEAKQKFIQETKLKNIKIGA